MTSEIRTNSFKSRTGLSTVTMTDTGPIISGVTTANNFKTGSSNLHSTGLTVGNTLVHSTGVNVGTGATVHSPTSNVLTLGTNNNERVRVDSSGRLIVGSYAAANPKSSGAGSIDLDNQAFTIIVGGNHPSGGRSDNTAKTFRMSMVHNTLAEEPINILQGYCDSSDNNLYIGGGTGSANSLTQVRVYTGTNTTTTGGTERIRVNNAGAIGLSGANYGSSGQVLTSQGSGSAVAWSTVAAGGASNISFNSGNGIDFSATGDGTGSSSRSELLDDYESGEWTGTINSGSANINNPWYVKIGKLVIGGGSITAISDTSSSNSIIVNGLPFSNSGGNTGRGSVSGSKNNQFDKMCDCYVSGTTVRFMVSSLSTGSHDYLRHSSQVQSSGSISFGFNYQTS